MKKAVFFMVLALSGMVLSSCAFHSSRHTFGPYSEAEDLYNRGDYSKAIEKYQEYLNGHPQGNMAAIAEYYIAKSYAASGDAVKARESFEQVVKVYPQTTWADFAKEQLGSSQGAAQSS